MSTRRYIMILVAGALALAAPTAIAESQLGAAPDGSEPAASGTSSPAAAPTSEPASDPTSGPIPEPTPQAGVDAMPAPPPEPGGAVEPEQTPEPDAGAAPESGAEPGAGATPDRPQEDTTAATPEPTPQAPASPSQSTGNSGAPCVLTSAGFDLPGQPGLHPDQRRCELCVRLYGHERRYLVPKWRRGAPGSARPWTAEADPQAESCYRG